MSWIIHSPPVLVAMMKGNLHNTSTAINLDNHGDAGLYSTWSLAMASIMLTIPWENLPDAVKNRSVIKMEGKCKNLF